VLHRPVSLKAANAPPRTPRTPKPPARHPDVDLLRAVSGYTEAAPVETSAVAIPRGSRTPGSARGSRKNLLSGDSSGVRAFVVYKTVFFFFWMIFFFSQIIYIFTPPPQNHQQLTPGSARGSRKNLLSGDASGVRLISSGLYVFFFFFFF
jgi:hypothetical protein